MAPASTPADANTGVIYRTLGYTEFLPLESGVGYARSSTANDGRYPTSGGNQKYAPEMAVKVGEVMSLRRAFDVGPI